MKNDIMIELAIEKIRVDFGDLVASLFKIISIHNNCFFGQIMSLFCHLSYKTVRNGIIILFQHNLIFFENFQSFKNSSTEKIHFTKLSSIISEAIYRIRYPRFVALIEYDYGSYGASIFKLLINSGQLSFSFIKQNSSLNSQKVIKIVEDILIHMARDRVIVNSDVSLKSIQLCNLFGNKNSIFFFSPKPLLDSKLLTWKISSQMMNLRLKLNILFSLLQEYQNFHSKSIIKFYLSKLLSGNIFFIHDIWFSIDTLIDFCKDEMNFFFRDERFILATIENSIFFEKYVELKKNFFKLNLINLFLLFQEKLIENLITNQFGKKFGVIFKILSNKKIHEESEIISKSGLNKFHTKTILYHMHRTGLVFLEDTETFRKILKSTRFWKMINR